MLALAAFIVRELAGELAADWLTSNLWVVGDFLAWRWSSVVVAVGILAVLLVAWEAIDRRRDRGGSRLRVKGTVIRKKKHEPLAVEYAGIRWVHDGWLNADDPDAATPIARAECPKHKVQLFFRQCQGHNELGVPRRITDYDFVRIPKLGTLWCPHGKGHSLSVQTSVPQTAMFGKLREVAVQLLWNEL